MKDFDMRVAFPTNDRNQVEEHFGHAKEFAFANVKDGKVISTEYLTPPHTSPVLSPNLSEKTEQLPSSLVVWVEWLSIYLKNRTLK